jgi:hypothetical protein
MHDSPGKLGASAKMNKQSFMMDQ